MSRILLPLLLFVALPAIAAPSALRSGETLIVAADHAAAHVLLADLDDDLYLDVLAIDTGGAGLLLNGGTEGLSEGDELTLGAGIVDAASCDLDDDGRDDVVAVRGTGAATFELVVYLQQDDGLARFTAAGDGAALDLDCGERTSAGARDLVAIASADNRVHLASWNAGAGELSVSSFAVDTVTLSGVALAFLAGAREVIVIDDTSGENVLRYRDSGAGFVLESTSSTLGGHVPHEVKAADVSGDGDDDIILLSNGPSGEDMPANAMQVAFGGWFSGGAQQAFETTAAASAIALGDPWVYSTSLRVPDAVVVSQSGAGLSLHESVSGGSSFQSGVPAWCTSGCGGWTGAPSTSPAAVAVGRLYERCAEDIAVAVPSQGVVIVPGNGPEGPYLVQGDVLRDDVAVGAVQLTFLPGGETTSSDGDGRYSIMLSRSGRHRIVASDQDGAEIGRAEVDVDCAGSPLSFDVVLNAPDLPEEPDAGPAPMLEDAGPDEADDGAPPADDVSDAGAPAHDTDDLADEDQDLVAAPGCACGATTSDQGWLWLVALCAALLVRPLRRRQPAV